MYGNLEKSFFKYKPARFEKFTDDNFAFYFLIKGKTLLNMNVLHFALE
jgi:hypothetical protein